jgi:predicted ATPase
MLCWEMRSYHLARAQAGPVFFDRGVPDVFEEAVRTYEAMVATYRGYGYELVGLPRSSVAERVRFVSERAGVRK